MGPQTIENMAYLAIRIMRLASVFQRPSKK